MRFITKNTNKGDVKDPLSLNLYVYCVGNPVKFFDPSGNRPADPRPERLWYPLVWRTTVTSNFGMRVNPIKQNVSFHEGADLGGLPIGKPVYAVSDGTTAIFDKGSKSWRYNWISWKFRESTGPHLHFELYLSGAPGAIGSDPKYTDYLNSYQNGCISWLTLRIMLRQPLGN